MLTPPETPVTISSRMAGARTETAPNTEIPAQLKAFGSYFTEELLKSDLDAMTSEELVALVNANQAAVDACSLWGNDAVMNHFFDKAAIKAFISDATTARDKSLRWSLRSRSRKR